MERKHELARHSGFDRDYWLCRCQGFRVDSPQGRIGFVRELRFASRQDRPDLLAVRAGLFGTRLLLVPVEEVEDILPKAKRIRLKASPTIAGSERRARLPGARRHPPTSGPQQFAE